MKIKLEDINKAVTFLKEYSGENPYIQILKKKAFIEKNPLNDFDYEYILKNYNFEPVLINKIIRISDWLAEKKKTDWELDFLPEKLLVSYLIGETEKAYCVYVKYRQSQEKYKLTFLPKSGVITSIKTTDFSKMEIDLTKYNNILKEINPKWAVMKHQEESIKFLLNRKKCILSLDQGLGKTMTSIIAADIEMKDKNSKVLVICPASLKTNWKREIETFIPSNEISIIRSVEEMKRDELIDFLKIKKDTTLTIGEMKKFAKERGKWNEGKKYTILNFDIIEEFHQLPKSRKKDDIQEAKINSILLNSDFDYVIIDEAHKLSNSTSNRYKIIKDYLKKAKHEFTWLLTGTMMTNNPQNFYNVLSLIDEELTKDYYGFMTRYCGGEKILKSGEWQRCWNIWNRGRYNAYDTLDYKSKQIFREFVEKAGKHIMINNGATNLEELREKTKHLYYRVMMEDIEGMVKKEIIPIVYELNQHEKYEYDKLWEEYLIEKEKECKDLSDLKCLIEGGVYRQYVSKLMMENTKRLVDNFNEDGEKVFVICAYDDEIYGLKEYFGDKAVIYNGKITTTQKDKAVYEFNNNPEIKVFLANSIAGGVGINLNKACKIAVFQNLDYTPSSFAQVCDRIHRIGSEEDVEIYVQYYKDTVYERIVNIIDKKQEIITQVIKKETEKT